MKIIFAGTSEFAVPILKGIKEKTNWNVSLVISEPAKPAGRGNKFATSPLAQTARQLNLNLITPPAIKSATSHVSAINCDVMIVAAYGQVLPRDIFDLPRYKTVNVHPSLLPKLRGPSPIQTALAQGLEKTGVSLVVVDEKIDHGPVISQESVSIDELDNYFTLETKLAELGAKMIMADLPEYISGEIKPRPQDDSQTTYTKLVKKEDGRINWSKMSAEEIYNLWRAYIKWPGIFTFFKNKSDKIIRLKLIELKKCSTLSVEHRPGEVFRDESKNLYIACRGGAIKIKKLQPESSKALLPDEFINGYGYVVGSRLLGQN